MVMEKIKAGIGDKAGVLKVVAELAEARGEHSWLVGGMVRDALLGLPSTDADVAVSCDAVSPFDIPSQNSVRFMRRSGARSRWSVAPSIVIS